MLYSTHMPTPPRPLIGHQRQIAALDAALRADAIAHAYLITGPQSVGKWAFAEQFAGKLTGQRADAITHPDILVVDESGQILIEQVRDLQHAMNLSPHTASRKVCLINNAHLLTEEAANALLKTLEEPPRHSIFILVTDRPGELLATIKSRTAAIQLGFVDRETLTRGLAERELASQDIDRLWRFFGGRPGKYLAWKRDPGLEQLCLQAERLFAVLPKLAIHEKIDQAAKLSEDEHAETIVDYWLGDMRQLLLRHYGVTSSSAPQVEFSRSKSLAERITHLERARALLATTANKKLIFEHLLLNL